MTATPDNDLLDLTAEVVAAYVTNNTVPARDLADLIISVHAALSGLGASVAPASVEEEVQNPTAAQIRKSVTPDVLISFVDGRSYKSLKRHLGTHGLTPDSYRARYGLPSDYPMIASNYAAQRSALAKQIGLGRIGGRPKQRASS
ncbi:MucR family transcriptional regulator [Methylobacterium sp. J-043]|nr:MucR family transcriptional regulator [Methylobacterium sp. J-043]